MRSEKEVYDIVLNFAKTDKRIRMVTLEGSRTNTNIPPDDFQDFDITFFVDSAKAGRYGIISSCRKGIFIFNAVY